MDADQQALATGVSALLGWEQRKRREKTLLIALCVALLAALAVPLFVALPRLWAWSAPLALFALIAPALLFARRWRGPDTARSVAALDKALGADERVTTAWEFVQRNDTRAVARLVLRQACERVGNTNVRALFPRRWDKRSLVVVPLLALWLGLTVFEARFGHDAAAPPETTTLARELRDFARKLLEKARVERLPKTMEAARELQRLAQRGIDARSGDDALRREVDAARKKIAAQANAAGQASSVAATSQRELEDLSIELQTARDWLAAPASASQSQEALLGKLTQLRRHGEWQQHAGGQALSRKEVSAFLDKLEKRVTAELDRRALQRTERQLRQFAQREPGQGARRPGPGGRAERDDTIDPMLDGQPSSPGAKPGTAASGTTPLPEYQVESRSAVKGTIGEGTSSSIFLKGRPTPGKSRVAEDKVIAEYQRRAEAELNTEQIPGELKDAIRSYFLSLDQTK